ncbi:MAG: hypothetical protein EA377_10330 [Phycisphaerales bacterium]|nr:MAG: hypothetical protein EA377_10330 [Phycisphaerales bacterium]
MKNRLIQLYRRLDLLQEKRGVRIALSVLVLAICGALFIPLLMNSYGLESDRRMLLRELEGQTLREFDVHAVSLRDTGTMTVNGRVFEVTEFRGNTDLLFDESGQIAVPNYLVEDLLRDRVPAWMPHWLVEQPETTLLLSVSVTAWLLLAIWIGLLLPFILTAAGTLLAVLISRWLGSEQLMLAVAGIGLLTFTFVLLSRGMLAALSRPNQILAVAHTVVKEAARSRISLVFIILLLLTLPLIPLGLDPEDPLRYRVQTFISRSIGLTFVISACMTLFLSCATVAFEIRDRQIWHLVSKPLSRFNYLLGKWLGVAAVNLILITVAGVSTFTFIQYLRTTPVAPGIQGQLDVVQVNNDVLSARRSVQPTFDTLTVEEMRERVDRRMRRLPPEAQTLSRQQEIEEEVRREFDSNQRVIPAGLVRPYLFEGLGAAYGTQTTMTLRYRFHIMRSDQHETFDAAFMFNDDPDTTRFVSYSPTMSHVLLLGADLIREDGTIEVAVGNMFEPPEHLGPGAGGIYFESGDFRLMYTVGHFEANFVRAMLIMWLKLCFLAMLGIACATFLSFPVACLFSFTIFMAGSLGPFLAMALEEYYVPYVSEVNWADLGMVINWAFRSVIFGVASVLVLALNAFGAYSPTNDLVQGLMIPWFEPSSWFNTDAEHRDVFGAVLVFLVIWSGIALVSAFAVFRRRQLAVYSGTG